jgi:hypothetical protein
MIADDPERDAKLAELRALQAAGTSPRVSELVLVAWPLPDGPIYYATRMAADVLESATVLDQLDGPIELRLGNGVFLDTPHDAGIADDSVPLDFWDGDHEITRLTFTYGAGIRVELFYYFPDVDLFVSEWFGHLQPPTAINVDRVQLTAEAGFRSSSLPLPARAFYTGCQAVFGGLLATQPEIDEGDCPYNRHLGGSFGNLDPATSAPFTSCPRNTTQVCVDRLGDALSYLAFDTVAESHVVHETKGPNITVTSRGNETNLKRPLRVIAGQRHVADLDLLAFVVEPDTKHPDGGSVKCLFACCEGPLQSIGGGKINGTLIAPQHNNFRNGDKRQPQSSFSPNILNYSGTALFLGVAQGDFSKSGAADLRGEVDIEGLRDVRVYSDPATWTEQYSMDRAWWLLHLLRNKRWGYGLDVVRFFLQDFIDLALWCAEVVAQKDQAGNDTTGQRTQFHAELIDRTAQQQITDLCLAGRFGLPFPDRGLLRVMPLRRAAELFSTTVFTDQAFWSVLNRAPSTSEANTWIAALQTAQAAGNDALWHECQQRELGLFHSAEYAARARTDVEFVTDCYHAYLRRPPDDAGLAFWLDQVTSNGRDAVLDAFNQSTEFQNLCADHPVATFTDRGDVRNICLDQGKTSLAFSMQSDADLCNRVVLTFDDETQQNTQIPLTFDDMDQQLRAGHAFGDTSRRAVERQFNAFGVTNIGEAGRLGNLLLNLGEFDEGGLRNNLRVAFLTWYLATVELHKYQIIKIESDKLDQINATRTAAGLEPFSYFRIRSLTRKSDLTVEISAQAYPEVYYDRLELLNRGPALPPTIPGGDGGFDPADPNGPARGRLPYNVDLIDLTHNNDQVLFTVGKEPV